MVPARPASLATRVELALRQAPFDRLRTNGKHHTAVRPELVEGFALSLSKGISLTPFILRQAQDERKTPHRRSP